MPLISRSKAIDYWSTRVAHFAGSKEESGAGHPAPLARLIHKIEICSILQELKLSGTEKMLDIGAGGGRWSISLAPFVREITALEPSEIFSVLQENTAAYANIECRKESCETYRTGEQADLIIISGVLMYLDDEEADAFIAKASSLLKEGGTLVLREPVSPAGVIRMDSEMYPGDARVELVNADYWEFLRHRSFYPARFRVNGIRLLRSLASHAPLFYYLPEWMIFRDQISKLSLQVISRDKYWWLIWHYNKLFRKPYEWVDNRIGRRSFRLFVFSKMSPEL
ncbi:MAG: methyltransferase domain-containing protein [Gammaproteobacteria bacterium]